MKKSRLLGAVCVFASSFFTPIQVWAITLIPTGDVIDPVTALLTHDAGGSASNPSGTNSVTYGAVGSSSLSIRAPSSSLVTGGSNNVTASSQIYIRTQDPRDPRPIEIQDPIGLRGEPISFDSVLYIWQYVSTSANFITSSVSSSVSLDSIFEFTMPDFGSNIGLVWSYFITRGLDNSNGGSASAAGTVSIENVTAGTTLLSTNIFFQSNSILLTPNPGDVLRVSFSGDVSGNFVPGDDWSQDASLHFRNTIGVVSLVPIPPAVWLFGSGLLGLVGIARRKQAA